MRSSPFLLSHRSARRRPVLLGLAVCLGMAAGGRASAEGIVRADEIVVETELLTPAEIYQDTPVETEILTAEDLRELPGTDAIDVLDSIPGLRITPRVQGQRGAVQIDGLPPEFTEILVNGQRYAGENGEAVDLGDQLVANLERIEILRGPQALRYSPSAAGGVLDFITADPPTTGATFGWLGGAGSQDWATAELNLGWGNERYGGVLTYDFNQQGGFNDPNPGSRDADDGLASPYGRGSLFRAHDLYATLVARPREGVEFKTRLGYRLSDDAFAVSGEPVSARRENERWLLSQELRLALGDATEMFNIFTFSFDDQESTVGRESRFADDLARLQSGFDLFAAWGSTTHLITLGVDLSSNGIDLEDGPLRGSIDNPDLSPTDIRERFHRAGVYGVVESEWTDWLQTSAGLRYQMHEDFKPELLPQAAVLLKAWKWSDDRALKLRFSIGQAARFPTLRSLYQPPTFQLGYFLSGSQDLEPEKVWAVRGGVEANPVRWWSGSVVGFYNEVDDAIRSQPSGSIQIGSTVIPANILLCNAGRLEFCTDRTSPVLASVFEKANLDDLETHGVEARMELRPHELLELHLGYTYTRTRVADSTLQIEELPNSPRHVANARLKLKAPVLDTVLTLRGQWRDRALLEGSGTGLLSFATTEESNTSIDLDARLLQPLDRWLHQRVDFFIDGRNLTDNRVIDSNVVRGTSYLIGLKGHFK